MKKSILMAAIMISCVCAMAQGKWEELIIKGDALKDTKDNKISYFESAKGETFNIYENDNTFSVECEEYQFYNYKSEYDPDIDDLELSVAVTVGLYDAMDNLKERIPIKLSLMSGDENLGFSPDRFDQKNYSKTLKIISHLQKENGYIRILAPIYGGASMDFKVYCKRHMSQTGIQIRP